MAPVNLDYQVPWTPRFALNGRSRAASRRTSGTIPLSDKRVTYDDGGAVQLDQPAVGVSGQSSKKTPRTSPDLDLSLQVSGGQDRSPGIDLSVSILDNTPPHSEQIIESAIKEQLKGEGSHAAKAAPLAVDAIPDDKVSWQLTSPMEQTCVRCGVVNAKCSTSPQNGLHNASTTATAAMLPESHTSHESYVPHDFGCTSCPIDPALVRCHRGEIDTWSEVPGACDLNQSACSLEVFGGHDLYVCELGDATGALSLATATDENCYQGGIETHRQLSPGYEVPDSGLPYFVTARHGQKGTVRSDDAQPSAAARRTQPLDHGAEEHAHPMQPPRKRRKVGRLRPLPSPPASISTENESEHVFKVAQFEEWVLENALLKRIMVNGVATFQLQFDWDLCAMHGGLAAKTPKQVRRSAKCSAPQRQKSGVQGKFSPDEDNSIICLKEELQLSWTEIHRRHTEQYPGRSKGSLQVRYCTKLKDRK